MPIRSASVNHLIASNLRFSKPANRESHLCRSLTWFLRDSPSATLYFFIGTLLDFIRSAAASCLDSRDAESRCLFGVG
ncbi:hypothetical protein Pan14r_37310 [Crateriforma conspicua]|uniref:Uncharacterized protein n=1 Tax=Crateriforma conspicua TaxID=2527996 RepID=A0A5C5YAE2_9PLAN|nr:hypothetical protein Pan14r_37310 [Crateriforma conspicua]